MTAWALIASVGGLVAVIVVVVTPETNWELTGRIEDPGPDLRERWRNLHRLLGCQRDHVRSLSSPVLGEEVHDPRTGDNHGRWIYYLAGQCELDLTAAAADRRLPAEARAALAGWQTAAEALEPVTYRLGDYYWSQSGFDQDDLATGREHWPELRRQVAAVLAAIAEVAKVANPAIRADLRATVEHDSDVDRASAAYRHGELHLALVELDEILFADPPDPQALRAGASRVRPLAADSPPALAALAALGTEAGTALDLPAVRDLVLQALQEVVPTHYPQPELR